MKKCTSCGVMAENLACACPACGPTAWMVVGDDVTAMEEVRQKQQESADHVDRGVLHIRTRQWSLARRELQQAQLVNPLNPVAWSNYGYVLLQEGKAADAAPYLEKALALNPKLDGVREALLSIRRSVDPHEK